jgi:hypothetical protein
MIRDRKDAWRTLSIRISCTDPIQQRPVSESFFFHNCGMEGPTFWNDENPITSMIAAEKAMGKHKMSMAARLMHSTILCQPDPAKSRTHFLLLLDSYWADRKPEIE